MISRFTHDTALLLIDCQNGVDELEHWGGPNGRRNNPHAETRISELLGAWRERRLPVYFTTHDSREAASPLKLAVRGGAIKADFAPLADETVIRKDVNSAFIGTALDILLRRRQVNRLVVAGFFTNMCISTTVRMANNLAFDTYLVDDACACTNRLGFDGVAYEPDTIHAVTVASLHGEFCTALRTGDALALLDADLARLNRVQGNE